MKQAIAIIDELISLGIHDFFISPGSRSAPLTLAVASCKQAKAHIHFDERGLGFYALGFSKAALRPSVIITTSGSAVANLYPAIMEAYHAQVPLIILTADRPNSLLNCGSNQTTNQSRIFANCIRAERELTLQEEEASIRSILQDCYFWSMQNPKGPVHINCPHAEPYEILPFESKSIPSMKFSFPKLSCDPISVPYKKGVILIGETQEDITPILALAKRLKWPVFADILSQNRKFSFTENIRHFDFILSQTITLEPDILLRFGGKFLSKNISNILKCPAQILVNPNPHLQDSERTASERVQSSIEDFCQKFSASTEEGWLEKWQDLVFQALNFIQSVFSKNLTEAHLIKHLPFDRPIFFGNSTVIRFADRFFFPPICSTIFASRGVSGIDGNIATIAGIYEHLQTPIIGIIGDQTALYDLNSIGLLKNKNILLIIINNFAGAIFDYLPMAKTPYLEKFFNAKHSLTFEHAAQMFQIPYEKRENDFNNLPSKGIVEFTFEKSVTVNFLKDLKKASEEFFNTKQTLTR